MYTERPLYIWLIFGIVYALQTTLSFELPIEKNLQNSDGYRSRSSDPQKDGGDWVDDPPMASPEPSYHREMENQDKRGNPESDYVSDFEVYGEQPVMVAKRYLCRQSFVYNPVSGRCQPSLSALRKGRAQRPMDQSRADRHQWQPRQRQTSGNKSRHFNIKRKESVNSGRSRILTTQAAGKTIYCCRPFLMSCG